MYNNIFLIIVIVLFVYKLLLKPLHKFSSAIISKNDDRNDLKTIDEIFDIRQLTNISLGQKRTKHNRSNRNEFGEEEKCGTGGIYLGPTNVPVDCVALCGSLNYKYKFIGADDSLIINFAFLSKSGGYCLPDDQYALRCNTYTSKLVRTADSWKCLPKGNLFGGDDGCLIVGCNGFIKDNLTGIYYNNRIPMTLALSNPDDEFVDGEGGQSTVYRFQCTDTEVDPVTGEPTINAKNSVVKDFMNNKLIESEYSRFDRIRNVCASLIYNASDIIVPNFRDGTCSCLAKYHSNTVSNNVQKFVDGEEIVDVTERCSPCVSGWSRKEQYTNVGIPCRKAFDDTPVRADKILLPCGVNGFDSKGAACLNVKIYVSKGLSAFARKVFT